MGSLHHSPSTLESELKELDSMKLQERLKNLGENPYPVTNTINHVHLKRLLKIEVGNDVSVEKVQQKTNKNIVKLRNANFPSTHSRNKGKKLVEPLLVSKDSIQKLGKVNKNIAIPSNANFPSTHSRNSNKKKELVEPSLVPKDSIQKLDKVNKNIAKPSNVNFPSSHSLNLNKERELLKPSLLSINEWIEKLEVYKDLENEAFRDFTCTNSSRKRRESEKKRSFNYLLLDPRITKDLARRHKNLTLLEEWETFLMSIFYVGKGKQDRPYDHLLEALKYRKTNNPPKSNKKINRILDIWNEDKGVIILYVFHNTIPEEALTREATMIETLGTKKLANRNCGTYYGVVSTWKSKEKCELGGYLLYKCLEIYLCEGERQIFPNDV